MNAKEARKITSNSIEKEKINSVLQDIYKQINNEALKGNYSISIDINKDLGEYGLECIREDLKKKGYKVIRNPAGISKICSLYILW